MVLCNSNYGKTLIRFTWKRQYWLEYLQVEYGERPVQNSGSTTITITIYPIDTVEPRYLELAYFELPLISKWKSGPCFNMKLLPRLYA